MFLETEKQSKGQVIISFWPNDNKPLRNMSVSQNLSTSQNMHLPKIPIYHK